ncbi:MULTISPECIES: serine protease inhibitor ecotin [Amniculibacterium]|uniref:serine protease inhibitor ecotin n=1 Tax=Amniculibacterium TaxID=2715289 RepID=UPI000F59E1D6|nr:MULTISPECIES: serine protease inhibitor ecotin [Amniculibacterium]
MKKLALFLAAFAFATPAFAQKKVTKDIQSEIKMFPKAKPGYKQVYIKVPAMKNENDYKVEVFAGKTMLVDCNNHRMMGDIDDKNLDGWGYTYYEVESNGQSTSTMMGCPDQTKTKKFIYMQPELLRYNSKLPIVIYAPKDMEVKYRIWKADSKFQNSKSL